jgi:hypothetical protein
VVYPVDGTPYSISRGMLQTVHGGAGFVVTSGCNGFVMEPGLGAGGLPVAGPAVPPFTDLATAPHRGAIVAESISCVWRGFPDGTFHPNAPLTRAQLAAILTRFAPLRHPPAGACRLAGGSLAAWALRDECAVVADALMGTGGRGGAPGTFGPPDTPVTIRAFAIAVARWQGWIPADGAGPAAVEALHAHGVWVGAASIDHIVTRAEAAELLDLLHPRPPGRTGGG